MMRHFYRKTQPYFIIFIASLFYLYEFMQRVAPQTMMPQLMQHFTINEAGLGVTAALFYWGYTPMQVPSGLLVDRYSIRYLMTATVLICTLGGYCFSLTQNIWLADLARLLMGAGASFAYVGALLLAARWLKGRYFAMVVGFVQLLGSLGAIMGERPVAMLVESHGWQYAMNVLTIVGLILAGFFFFIIRDKPPQAHSRQKRPKVPLNFKQIVKQVFSLKQNAWICLSGFCCWGPVSIFAAFWGPAYLMSLYHIDIVAATSMVSLVWVGIMVGGPVFGWGSAYYSNRRYPLIIASLMAILSTLVVLYLPTPTYLIMAVALFFFGVAASAMVVTFGLIHDINHPNTHGTAVALNNVAVLLGGLILLPLVGFIVNDVKSLYHIQQAVSVNAYRVALSMMLLIGLVNLFCAVFMIKETHCRKVHNH